MGAIAQILGDVRTHIFHAAGKLELIHQDLLRIEKLLNPEEK